MPPRAAAAAVVAILAAALHGRARVAAAADGVGSPSPDTVGGRWTWVAGPGEGGASNSRAAPGARCCAHTWQVGQHVWLFGGYGYDANGTQAYLSDLWSFDTVKREWTHRAGTLSGNQANTATGPAARNYGVVWLDAGDGFEGGASVRLWLWSGLGSRHDGDATGGYLDDLWSFSVADMHWTRHTPNAGPVASPSSSGGERWLLADRPAAREWTNSWSDGKGKVWVFSGVASGPPPYHMGTPNDLWCMDSTATGGPTWTLIYNYSSMAGVYHGPPAQVHPGFREGSMTAYEPPTKAAPGGRLHLYGGMGAGTNASDWGNLQDTWAYDVARRRWEYIAGPSKPGGRPVFGTKGVVAAGNVPPGEHAGYDWPLVVDGRAYFLGGENGEEVPAMRNDLWAYDVAAQQWAWMSGANVPNATARYGTRGVADASNVPGARYAGQGWATAGPSVACAGAGPELWLFGGYGYDIQGRRKYLSDVWTWRPVADDLPAC